MVGMMAAGWWELCGCAGVVWVLVWCSRVARLQGWEVARLQVYRQSKSIFLLVLYGSVIAFIGCFYTISMVYRSVVLVGCVGWGDGVGVLVGVVVPVVVEVGRAIPPYAAGWLER